MVQDAAGVVAGGEEHAVVVGAPPLAGQFHVLVCVFVVCFLF